MPKILIIGGKGTGNQRSFTR